MLFSTFNNCTYPRLLEFLLPVFCTLFLPSLWLLIHRFSMATTISIETDVNPIAMTIINPWTRNWPRWVFTPYQVQYSTNYTTSTHEMFVTTLNHPNLYLSACTLIFYYISSPSLILFASFLLTSTSSFSLLTLTLNDLVSSHLSPSSYHLSPCPQSYLFLFSSPLPPHVLLHL